MFNRKTLGYLAVLLTITAIAFALTVQDALLNKRVVTSGKSIRNTNDKLTIEKESAVSIVPGGKPTTPAARATVCNGLWQGNPAFALNNWFTGQEFYGVYQDPVEVGCAGGLTYPFQVDTVFWHVFNPGVDPFNIDLQPVIYKADTSDPLCPKPGVVCCYGPLYTVTVPVGSGGAIVGLPMDSGCCVDGPYFAGVWAPDYIGFGILGVVTDTAGLPGSFGNRVCANYNNYQGIWEDLIADYSFPGNLLLWSSGSASDENACDPCFPPIPPGVDLWTTPEDYAIFKQFQSLPIPADFFDPGSDPFNGEIHLGGSPLQTTPGGALDSTDMVILRNDEANLPSPGAVDVVPIEIVALSLTSIQPITVTFNGGQNPEQWDVDITLSSAAPQQPGTMTITKGCCNGGTFESTLPIIPKLIFTRVGDSQVRTYDLGTTPSPTITVQTQNGYWSHESVDEFEDITSPGMVAYDHDAEITTPDLLIPPSSKFRPGMRTIPCDPITPNDPFCGGIVATGFQSSDFDIYVSIPMHKIPVDHGTVCIPDGGCMFTSEACGNIVNPTPGSYAADCLRDCLKSCGYCAEPFPDTICAEGDVTTSTSPSDIDCTGPLFSAIGMQAAGDNIVTRDPDTPYTAGQTIQTEIVQMELVGTAPIDVKFGNSFGLPPSTGTVQVGSVDGSGNLTSGTATFDVYIEITLPSTQTLKNPDPIPLEAPITALPFPPGTLFEIPLTAPPILLVDKISDVPYGYLCSLPITISACTSSCCIGIRGDLNNDGTDANILDLNFAVNRVFRAGPLPVCPVEGDCNSDGTSTNILDLNFLVNRVFRAGPAPGPCP